MLLAVPWLHACWLAHPMARFCSAPRAASLPVLLANSSTAERFLMTLLSTSVFRTVLSLKKMDNTGAIKQPKYRVRLWVADP